MKDKLYCPINNIDCKQTACAWWNNHQSCCGAYNSFYGVADALSIISDKLGEVGGDSTYDGLDRVAWGLAYIPEMWEKMNYILDDLTDAIKNNKK